MDAKLLKEDSSTRICLSGRFDFNSHREFRTAVDAVLAEIDGQGGIVIDFAGVSYVDSSALGMLLMLRDRAEASKREIFIENAHGHVRQVLDIANFGRLFEIS